ncbi:E3 ubiquitin-protein ligase RNF1/2 [Marchantia polymorpha subsp. ruderalis]
MMCLICLGILRNTRTVMECLHRFCRECIDKAMRLGRKECPTYLAHCASRRSSRDDPHFDALTAAMFPDIEKLQEEESTLLEETLISNRQTQTIIEEAFKRQSEAMARFKRPKSIGSKTRIAKYSRVAGCEDERFRDISVVPDLNNAGAKSSISTNVNILHLVNNEAEVEMEADHGLRLLSELADQDEFSSLTHTFIETDCDKGHRFGYVKEHRS